MIRKPVTIINKLGLHARAAAKLVATASEFESTIQIVKDDREVDAKAIMPVMMLAASQGTKVELIVDGPDEEQALDRLLELINNYFGEGE
ncbi:MAG: HPr family phosphocarrier protein [Marinobacter sp.]|uniref:HPr family phosphocarrier protein n=1 Tax=Marinobacter sp. TaxID=50741 RepID=UPI00299E19D7|nr:HPr family phosphocarrier protein [Marinobacter sp.]MDX1756731.1 HPr family phosphocarrier protein [Marinobacter sp.]